MKLYGKKIIVFAAVVMALICVISVFAISKSRSGRKTINEKVSAAAYSTTEVLLSKPDETTVTDAAEKKSTRERINDVIEEKGLEAQLRELIYASYDQLNQNYDSAYMALEELGVMNKEEALELFCESLEYVKAIGLFKDGSAAVGNYVYYDMNDRYGFYDSDRNIIVVSLSSGNLIYKYDRDSFIHELTHVIQNKRGEDQKFKKSREGLYYVLSEGEASIPCCATSPFVEFETRRMYTNFAGDERIVLYGRAPDMNYNCLYKLYVTLMYLTSYQDVKDLLMTGDLKKFEAIIDSKYGMDSRSLMSRFEVLGLACVKGMECDIETCLKMIEGVLLDCMCKDIDTITERDDLIRFYNFYRFYKIQFHSTAVDGEEGFGTLENKLYKKCIQNQFLILSSDEEENRRLFDILLDRSEGVKRFTVISDCSIEYKDTNLIVSKNGTEFCYPTAKEESTEE